MIKMYDFKQVLCAISNKAKMLIVDKEFGFIGLSSMEKLGVEPHPRL